MTYIERIIEVITDNHRGKIKQFFALVALGMMLTS